MRRFAALVLALCGALVLPVPTASAQDEPSVRLRLLSQTPWNSTFDGTHGRELDIRFRAENLTDEPIENLSIGITVYGRLISRTAFELSLTSDVGFAIDAETVPREGPLQPGVPRDFEVVFPLDSAGISATQSGVYPVKVDLRSGFASLAEIRTATIFLVRQPELPLALSWTFVLHHPIAFDASGAFTSTSLETALAPGGRLGGEIGALEQLATAGTTPVDVVLSPVLLMQLERMSDGYEVRAGDEVREVAAGTDGAALAASALERLAAIANGPNVRVSAMPFAVPELPSLLAGGLGRDLPTQLQRGVDVVRSALETAPVAGVLRPPGAALDEDTLRQLAASSISTLIVGPTTVPRPEADQLGFAGPPTAALAGGAIDAVVPDPAVAALLQSQTQSDDPVLAAQTMLAELTTIWQEQPGVERGLAVVLPEDVAVPSAFYGPFVRGIASAPWLAPMHATDLVTAFPPEATSTLTVTVPRRFSSTYVDQLRQTRRRIESLRSMLVAPNDQPDAFETLLLLAESRQYLSDPSSGLALIASVRDSIAATLDAIHVSAPPVVTLSSRTGSQVPVTVSNGSELALRVSVSLLSQHLRNAPAVDLDLAAGESQLVTFLVDVRAPGRFTADVRVVAPGGRILEETSLIVRSTVYNRVALVLTVAAALVLVALWARRFIPRRTS